MCMKNVIAIVVNLVIGISKTNLRDFIAATGLVILVEFWFKSSFYSARITFTFKRWLRKTIGHLFYATQSFVHYSKATNEFQLGLLSGEAQFGSKSVTFFGPVWPWNWAPFLCGFKFCTLFRSHRSIQTGVTYGLENNRAPVRYYFMHHFIAICEYKLALQSKNAQIGAFFYLCDLDPWPLACTLCMDITFVNGNNSWTVHHDTVRETLWKRCHGRTGGQKYY